MVVDGGDIQRRVDGCKVDQYADIDACENRWWRVGVVDAMRAAASMCAV
jgi:hypothetical protein